MAGIVCLTGENKNNPWILFETGALAKGLSAGRVYTFLVDIEPADLQNPLAQFNHTLPAKDSLWKLVRLLNTASGNQLLDDKTLSTVFETYWPQFEQRFAVAIDNSRPFAPTVPKTEGEVLAEVLAATRGLANRISGLEAKLSAPPADSEVADILSRLGSLPIGGAVLRNGTVIGATHSARRGIPKGLLHTNRSNPNEPASE